MALGYRGKDWARVKREAQADAQRLQRPVYIFGDSNNGFYSEYTAPPKHRPPTAIFYPGDAGTGGQ